MSEFQAVPLVGQKIVEVRPMTTEEMENEGWDVHAHMEIPAAIVTEKGTVIFPMRDPEGNGPGCLTATQHVEGEEPVSYYIA